MTGTEIAAKLREALALMNNEGKHWVQGASRLRLPAQQDRYCSIGAIRQVVAGDAYEVAPDENVVLDALIAQIPSQWAKTYGQAETVIGWNDTGGRTWDEIAETFEKAAAAAEQT